ncbi:uncharacterized protein DC041_0002599 [Schistosoma bovis]|uniref:DUF4709 domain-containing protein n=1 Tax=Schistosoma bovis TaxID=6184 RepID=A0A430QGJ1_SCHBO|nr:uncharacterized protein DC041_0002599 [Schistosoma bovis]
MPKFTLYNSFICVQRHENKTNMAPTNNIPHTLKQSLLANKKQDPLCIDYPMLADILPKPPELPIPNEPNFIPNELYDLTIGKYHNGMKRCIDVYSQTDITELFELNELKNKLNNLILLINEYPKQINQIKNTLNYQMKLIIEEISLNIYEIMKSRIDNLSKSYDKSIEHIRGSCRTQLANTISVLNGLLNTAKRHGGTLIENSLRKRILELETVLQQNELDMKCLQEKFKELEDKYDSLNLEMPNIVISRSSSVELIPTRAIPPVSVVLVHEDKSVQVDSFDKKKESLEKEIKSLLEQIEVLKSALSAVQSQVRSLTEQRDQSEQKVNGLNNQLNEFKTNYVRLEKQLLDKTNELTMYKQKLQLKQQLDDLSKNKERLEHECDSLRNELARLNQKSKVLEPTTEISSASALREQALIAEIIRLRRDLNRLQEASESRIRCLKNRLQAISEEAFKRHTLELKVSQLHTAALKYANEFDQLISSNKLHNYISEDKTKCKEAHLFPLPPIALPISNKVPHQNTIELGNSLRSTLTSVVRTN